MLNHTTIDKLIEMHFTGMADAYRIQEDTHQADHLSFEERLGLLVDAEYTRRKDNRLKRLIRNAGFEQSDASVSNIDYQSGRKLNRKLISNLATCEYITEYRNIFITGATGSGKTYMACAFGMQACMHYYTVKYVRMPDLLIDLRAAYPTEKYMDVLKKYINPRLLILDEWLLYPLEENDTARILDLIHKRRKRSSTIFCSQYRDEGWRAILGGEEDTLADAIVDRIQHDAYKINIEPIDPNKDKSMREIYGLRPDLAQ